MDLIHQYFIEPILADTGYNAVNTIVYAILFLASIYLAKKVMEKLNIKIDKEWFWATFWIIPIGALLRVIEDWIKLNYGALPTHFLFVTPGIYILLAGIVVGIAYLEKEDYAKRMKAVGKHLTIALIIVYILLLLLSGVHNIAVAITAVVSAGMCGFVIYKILEKLGYSGKENLVMLLGHSLDGFVSALSIMMTNYSEKHVVTGILMKATNPLAYPLVKLAIASLAVILAKDQIEDEEWRMIILLFLTIIGLGPGTRDLLRIILGV